VGVKLTGFEAVSEKKQRLIVNVQGLEKCGKTHFALTFPDPIAMIDIDVGTEGVVDKNKKEVLVKSVGDFHDPVQAQTIWQDVKLAIQRALDSKQVRTVVIDTATELWELLRMARFGKLTQVMPHHYGPVNAEYRELVRRFFESDKNLVLLHKMKPLYVNGDRTNKYQMSGFSEIPFLVQVNIEVARDDGDFKAVILNCRQDMGLADTELYNEMIDYETVNSLIYG
jgi:hypothetical protein